jgi:hypothetical protein
MDAIAGKSSMKTPQLKMKVRQGVAEAKKKSLSDRLGIVPGKSRTPIGGPSNTSQSTTTQSQAPTTSTSTSAEASFNQWVVGRRRLMGDQQFQNNISNMGGLDAVRSDYMNALSNSNQRAVRASFTRKLKMGKPSGSH